MTDLTENRVLMDAFRSGRKSAMKEVYCAYSKGLFGMLAKGFHIETGETHYYFKGYQEPWKLENAVQEVFVRAFSDSARMAYDGVRPYRNYLFMIARNYVIDSFRKNRREFVPIDELPVDKVDSPMDGFQHRPPSPEKAAFEKRMHSHVGQFVTSLSTEERSIYEARFVQGQSIEGVAKELDVTEYRVKKHEKRIKKRFFKYMRGHGYFEGYRYGDLGVESLIIAVFIYYGVMGSC
jgi:RNA polymerase sigma factor (sigma-70 family)